MRNFEIFNSYETIKFLFFKQSESSLSYHLNNRPFNNADSFDLNLFTNSESSRTFYEEMILRVYFSISSFNLIFFIMFALAYHLL